MKYILFSLISALFLFSGCEKITFEDEPIMPNATGFAGHSTGHLDPCDSNDPPPDSCIPISDPQVWGVTNDGQIWKWDEIKRNWYRPNPLSKPLYSISKGYLGGLMGVGDNDHIWKYVNGTWQRANGKALKVSTISDTHAYALGYNGRVFRTSDGGTSWDEIFFSSKIIDVSAGSTHNVYVIDEYDHILKYEYDGDYWYEPNVKARATQISASCDNVWSIGYNDRIFKSKDGKLWDEPNKNAKATDISAASTEFAWALGYAKRIFRTAIGGTNWDEPRPGAGLKDVTVGYGDF